jgi:hypothetical protein
VTLRLVAHPDANTGDGVRAAGLEGVASDITLKARFASLRQMGDMPATDKRKLQHRSPGSAGMDQLSSQNTA